MSISSLSSQLSPSQLLQQQLQAEVSDGTIPASDQSALSSALDSINTALTTGSAAQQPAQSSSASPTDLKSKIDSLIADQVSSGKLTADQATELQSVFANAFANGPGGAPPPADSSSNPTSATHGAGGHHHGHHGGGVHGDDASNSTTASTDSSLSTDGSSSDSSSGDSTGTSPLQLLQDFLKASQDAQSSNATYSSDGSNTSSLQDSLLINYVA